MTPATETTAPSTTVIGAVRPRRIFSCYGDGAKAIPRDPELLYVSATDRVYAVGLEVQSSTRILAFLCYAPGSAPVPSGFVGADMCEPPAPTSTRRWSSPSGCEDRSVLRAAALAVSSREVAGDVAAEITIADDRTTVRLTHASGRSGTVQIQEFAGYLVVRAVSVPPAVAARAVEAVRTVGADHGMRVA
jgi:hypothetical protein